VRRSEEREKKEKSAQEKRGEAALPRALLAVVEKL
jgi:hypothetical protein